jgi:hypothetical protein
MDITYAASLMRAWAARRAARGTAVTADETWTRICARWPRADEWQRERVFQLS